ncbi:Fructose-1,6-bisphosphatase [Podila horticola]|nr:Fructose-1,6-bisphosphatase [Podila horticola]
MSDPSKTNLITLTRHVFQDQVENYKEASGDLTLLLTAIQLGCKFVASNVRKASLISMTGLANSSNVQGEEQKKLDVIANEIFVNALRSSNKVAVMVSEEDEEAIIVETQHRGKYCVVFDPLDGSSNIDCGVSIGTIFGIYKVKEDSTGQISDVLRPGSEMVAAGYCTYGSCSTLVLTTGQGIQIPSRGKIYAVNEGNSKYWDGACMKYFHSLKFPEDPKKSPYSARYVGSMVADVHRTMLYGGIFCYPADSKSKNGKLRILYECFPMAFLVEQAGGRATTGRKRMLDVQPETIHARSPIFLGSTEDVQDIEAFYKAEA